MGKRIQRKRTKGWRMPANAVYVGRSTKWGNPFRWKDYIDNWCNEGKARRFAVDDYHDWLNGIIRIWSARRSCILDHLHELRGFDLVCWCPLDQPCHADVLLELLNEA